MNLDPHQLDQTADKPPLLAVGLTAAWVLLFETVFFQIVVFVTNYLEACQVIALALLGIGLGGILAAAVPARRAWAVSATAAWLLPLAVLASLFLIARFPWRPGLIELALAPPFVLGSLVISIQLTKYPCHRIYFADLLGAAGGVLCATLALPLLREEGSVLLLVALGAFSALILHLSKHGRPVLSVQLLAGLISGLALFGIITNLRVDWLNLVEQVRPNPADPDKIFSRLERARTEGDEDNFRYLLGLGSLIERVDVVKRRSRGVVYYNGYPNDHFTRSEAPKYQWDRRLPVGLARVMDPEQRALRALLPDGARLTRIERTFASAGWSSILPSLKQSAALLRELNDPGSLRSQGKDVLVIGPAAEGITKPAKLVAGEDGRLVGVEINPAIVRLMTRIYPGEPSGGAYENMELHVMDARSYLARTDRRFDMITMLNTHRIRTVGDVGPPEYLHSYEAFATYFARLRDSGLIVLEERELTDKAPFGVARIILTAGQALRERCGAQDPARHIIVYNWSAGDAYVSILIKKTPFTDQELAWLEHWRVDKRERSKQPVWRAFPGLRTGHLYEAAARGDGIEELAPRTTHNMAVIIDDRPFPYDVFRARPEHHQVIKRVASFALLLGALPALLFGLWLFCIRQARNPGRAGLLLLYAMSLGFGYLMTEMVLIQRFQMFLNSPIWAVLVVLGVMLFGSGLGSLIGGGWRGARAAGAFVVILLLIAGMAYLVPPLLDRLVFLPLALRIAISALLVGAIGFAMGMPLPICLNMLSTSSGPRLAAMAFGLNGSAGALATSVALLTNKVLGFNGTLQIAAAAYAASLLLMVVVELSLRRRPAAT